MFSHKMAAYFVEESFFSVNVGLLHLSRKTAFFANTLTFLIKQLREL
jgi:hypothetical protein